MRPEEREAVLREGVHRAETPRERRMRDALHEDLVSSPLVARPVPLRLRNFTTDTSGYLASLGGPRAFMTRLREIERQTADLLARLEARRTELRRTHGDDFAEVWRAEVEGVRVDELNDLIARHNRWYPVESRLPMDPRRGDYALVNGRDYRLAQIDAAWILERLPAGERGL